MSGLYQNKYRISSARLQSWDYASEGLYFVTICTQNREQYFGRVIGDKLKLSSIGNIARDEWFKTPGLRPDMNLELGEFVVMPNHIHGIIIIGENQYNSDRGAGGLGIDEDTNARRDAMQIEGRDAMHRVSTTTTRNTQTNTETTTPKNQFDPQRKNLASIIRGYKSAVTTYARKNQIDFAWQPRFYEHIIRSPDDYDQISTYIAHNPENWNQDKFFML